MCAAAVTLRQTLVPVLDAANAVPTPAQRAAMQHSVPWAAVMAAAVARATQDARRRASPALQRAVVMPASRPAYVRETYVAAATHGAAPSPAMAAAHEGQLGAAMCGAPRVQAAAAQPWSPGAIPHASRAAAAGKMAWERVPPAPPRAEAGKRASAKASVAAAPNTPPQAEAGRTVLVTSSAVPARGAAPPAAAAGRGAPATVSPAEAVLQAIRQAAAATAWAAAAPRRTSPWT
mmetsp:Transcript_49819/g.128521  ORF Transcript_49819/g.128521 Transcript_49819/m.128521 type:complete len:234 (+) Transcript_49819:1015-1716(+)